MIFTEALADIGREIKTKEIAHDAAIIAELLDYLRWLADQDTGYKFTAGQLWELYHQGVRIGRFWSEVCEDIGLPVRDEW
jgi:hypothetical protein